MSNRPFVFVDEAGNSDFSKTGTTYYSFTSVIMKRPFNTHGPLDDLRHGLMEAGNIKKRFHASEDEQEVRDAVFGIIGSHIKDVVIDAVLVEKCKLEPEYRELKYFYPYILGQLVRYVARRHSWYKTETPIFITDEVPVNKKKKALKDSIKSVLANMVPSDVGYEVHHHESMSSYGLQIADYCSWAIFRKWESGDTRSYELIQPAIMSEFDIFRLGTKRWY